jgi:ribosome biogenesis ATPase
MQGRNQVYVIAATNRPDMIDPAMLRPGRLDKTLYVDLPNQMERLEILKTLTRKTPLDKDVNLEIIASDSRCESYSGADLAALVREAAVTALRCTVYSQGINSAKAYSKEYKITVKHANFLDSFSKITASVGKKVNQVKVLISRTERDTNYLKLNLDLQRQIQTMKESMNKVYFPKKPNHLIILNE